MAFTKTDLDNVNSAIATGELKVETNGRVVIYRSIDDLIKARTIIASDLAVSSVGTGTRRGNFRVTFSTHRGS